MFYVKFKGWIFDYYSVSSPVKSMKWQGNVLIIPEHVMHWTSSRITAIHGICQKVLSLPDRNQITKIKTAPDNETYQIYVSSIFEYGSFIGRSFLLCKQNSTCYFLYGYPL
jgi:hypothetical protein